jgi:hypothetical protein
MPTFRRTPLAWLLAGLLGASACAEPPTREINQAQGAIDAARAAGAEQYAADELAAADAALKRAHTAVGERDYRQALSSALDARERARTAARESATKMAQLGRDTAQAIEAVARDLAAIRPAVTPKPGTRDAKGDANAAALAAAGTALQEARSALEAGRYTEAMERIAAVREAVARLSAAAAAPGPERRGRAAPR